MTHAPPPSTSRGMALGRCSGIEDEEILSAEAFEGLQKCFEVAALLATERRLSVRSRLQHVSKTEEDSRGREGIPGDSIDAGKRRGIRVLRRKSCSISRLVERG